MSVQTLSTLQAVEVTAQRVRSIDFVRKAFDSFDTDKSGYLDTSELRAAFALLGVNPNLEDMKSLGIEDKDGDGLLTLKDLDQDGDMRISFEEFQCLAAILPKREHAIYKGALQQTPITLPRDTTKVSDVQLERYEAQQQLKAALDAALKKLREKMGLSRDSQLLKDDVLLRKFGQLDVGRDGRVDMKELQNFLMEDNLTQREAWLIMNCADSDSDQIMTFGEFKKMMQTVAMGLP